MPIIYDLSKLPADTVAQIKASPRLTHIFSEFPGKLFGLDSNAKTVKGQKRGFKTAILYLAPAMMSGRQVCPMAKLAGCEAACLNTAGRGGMTIVQMSRLRKTLFWHQYPAEFKAMALAEIGRLKAKVARQGFGFAVRLNGTSDVLWEKHFAELFATHADVQFYDYTKIANRRDLPANYDLTYSYSGRALYAPFVETAKRAGLRIAAVWRDRSAIPASFAGMTVVDGDDSDLRFLEPDGVIVALYAKGAAKADTSGFVIG